MFRRFDRYGDRLNSYDLLKLIALFTMVIDHLGYYLLPHADILRAIGRMAFPLFLFLVGYSGMWKAKYELIVWAALITASAALTHQTVFPLDILITILTVRLILPLLLARVRLTPGNLTGIYIGCIVWWPFFYWCEYSTVALLFAISGVLQRRQPQAGTSPLFLCATMALYLIVVFLTFSSFGWGIRIITFLGLAFTTWLMHSFSVQPLQGRLLPQPVRRALQWAARNTLPLYGLHVILLMAIERLYFPERLLHFQWIN